MIVVYYCDCHDAINLIPRVEEFEDGPEQIGKMLARMRELHEQGMLFITSASHTRDGVVKGVIDGKLPDGTEYTWRKRRP